MGGGGGGVGGGVEEKMFVKSTTSCVSLNNDTLVRRFNILVRWHKPFLLVK